MSTPGPILERIENQAVSTVNNLGLSPKDAVVSAIAQFIAARQLEDEPSAAEKTDLIQNVINRTSFPPVTTIEGLDDATFTPTERIDGSWVDRIAQWPHRNALRRYWDESTNYSNNTKNNIDLVSEHILRHSNDPAGSPYHWRGLVVGNIQSGKTANFTKLIVRAFDAGYWIVVVLSGRLESLRRQTANRLDREVRLTSASTGRDVNHLTRFPDSDSLYSDGPYYDLLRQSITSGRTLWVLKKHYSVLDKMNDFFARAIEDDPAIASRPVLIIDDESDEAGVDISRADDEEEAPSHSRVHFELRRLISNPESGSISWRQFNDAGGVIEQTDLRCPGFERTMLVGFTATPYACCFQELNTTEEQDEQIGRDLYPRDYILVLDDPPNYCGGELFVGRHQVSVQDRDGRVVMRLPSFDPKPSEILQEIPEQFPCDQCRNETITDGDGKESYTHHRANGHFQPNSCLPINPSGCACTCHRDDEIHRVRAPFRDCGDHFDPSLAPSLSGAIDRFILAGAARAARNLAHRPATMMIQVSNWRGQHPRLRFVIEDRMREIREQYPSLGGHRSRLRTIWEDEFRATIRQFDAGFVIEGGGRETNTPDRQFPRRPRALDCSFEEIDVHIPLFLKQIRHITLNSDSNETLDYAAHLKEFGTGLKAVVYGGFALGRGLTLEGLLTSYFARVPGDQSVAMQLQRYCGYRGDIGEGILDLMRIYLPSSLAAGFSEMLSVECANRYRLGSYLREEHIPPIEVGPRLQETPGWDLVSAAKRGRMIVEMNPYAGKEKSQTTFRFTQDEIRDFDSNWDRIRNFVAQWDRDGRRDVGFDKDKGGFLFRSVPSTDVQALLDSWISQPHKMDGFPRSRMIEYIVRANGHDELEQWSVYIPSLSGGVTPSELEYSIAANGSLEKYVNKEVALGESFAVVPFSRALSQLSQDETAGGRIGTLTTPGWRDVDLVDGEERSRESGLLIVVPVIHPFNRKDPGSQTSNLHITPSRRFLPSATNPGIGEPWPPIPALSVVFPGDSAVRARELVHGQFAEAAEVPPGG